MVPPHLACRRVAGSLATSWSARFLRRGSPQSDFSGQFIDPQIEDGVGFPILSRDHRTTVDKLSLCYREPLALRAIELKPAQAIYSSLDTLRSEPDAAVYFDGRE